MATTEEESCQGKRFVVPTGLKCLLEEMSREVLRNQPDNIYLFLANYLEEKCRKQCGPECSKDVGSATAALPRSMNTELNKNGEANTGTTQGYAPKVIEDAPFGFGPDGQPILGPSRDAPFGYGPDGKPLTALDPSAPNGYGPDGKPLPGAACVAPFGYDKEGKPLKVPDPYAPFGYHLLDGLPVATNDPTAPFGFGPDGTPLATRDPDAPLGYDTEGRPNSYPETVAFCGEKDFTGGEEAALYNGRNVPGNFQSIQQQDEYCGDPASIDCQDAQVQAEGGRLSIAGQPFAGDANANAYTQVYPSLDGLAYQPGLDPQGQFNNYGQPIIGMNQQIPGQDQQKLSMDQQGQQRLSMGQQGQQRLSMGQQGQRFSMGQQGQLLPMGLQGLQALPIDIQNQQGFLMDPAGQQRLSMRQAGQQRLSMGQQGQQRFSMGQQGQQGQQRFSMGPQGQQLLVMDQQGQQRLSIGQQGQLLPMDLQGQQALPVDLQNQQGFLMDQAGQQRLSMGQQGQLQPMELQAYQSLSMDLQDQQALPMDQQGQQRLSMGQEGQLPGMQLCGSADGGGVMFIGGLGTNLLMSYDPASVNTTQAPINHMANAASCGIQLGGQAGMVDCASLMRSAMECMLSRVTTLLSGLVLQSINSNAPPAAGNRIGLTDYVTNPCFAAPQQRQSPLQAENTGTTGGSEGPAVSATSVAANGPDAEAEPFLMNPEENSEIPEGFDDQAGTAGVIDSGDQASPEDAANSSAATAGPSSGSIPLLGEENAEVTSSQTVTEDRASNLGMEPSARPSKSADASTPQAAISQTAAEDRASNLGMEPSARPSKSADASTPQAAISQTVAEDRASNLGMEPSARPSKSAGASTSQAAETVAEYRTSNLGMEPSARPSKSAGASTPQPQAAISETVAEDRASNLGMEPSARPSKSAGASTPQPETAISETVAEDRASNLGMEPSARPSKSAGASTPQPETAISQIVAEDRASNLGKEPSARSSKSAGASTPQAAISETVAEDRASNLRMEPSARPSKSAAASTPQAAISQTVGEDRASNLRMEPSARPSKSAGPSTPQAGTSQSVTESQASHPRIEDSAQMSKSVVGNTPEVTNSQTIAQDQVSYSKMDARSKTSQLAATKTPDVATSHLGLQQLSNAGMGTSAKISQLDAQNAAALTVSQTISQGQASSARIEASAKMSRASTQPPTMGRSVKGGPMKPRQRCIPKELLQYVPVSGGGKCPSAGGRSAGAPKIPPRQTGLANLQVSRGCTQSKMGDYVEDILKRATDIIVSTRKYCGGQVPAGFASDSPGNQTCKAGGAGTQQSPICGNGGIPEPVGPGSMGKYLKGMAPQYQKMFARVLSPEDQTTLSLLTTVGTLLDTIEDTGLTKMDPVQLCSDKTLKELADVGEKMLIGLKEHLLKVKSTPPENLSSSDPFMAQITREAYEALEIGAESLDVAVGLLRDVTNLCGELSEHPDLLQQCAVDLEAARKKNEDQYKEIATKQEEACRQAQKAIGTDSVHQDCDSTQTGGNAGGDESDATKVAGQDDKDDSSAIQASINVGDNEPGTNETIENAGNNEPGAAETKENSGTNEPGATQAIGNATNGDSSGVRSSSQDASAGADGNVTSTDEGTAASVNTKDEAEYAQVAAGKDAATGSAFAGVKDEALSASGQEARNYGNQGVDSESETETGNGPRGAGNTDAMAGAQAAGTKYGANSPDGKGNSGTTAENERADQASKSQGVSPTSRNPGDDTGMMEKGASGSAPMGRGLMVSQMSSVHSVISGQSRGRRIVFITVSFFVGMVVGYAFARSFGMFGLGGRGFGDIFQNLFSQGRAIGCSTGSCSTCPAPLQLGVPKTPDSSCGCNGPK